MKLEQLADASATSDLTGLQREQGPPGTSDETFARITRLYGHRRSRR